MDGQLSGTAAPPTTEIAVELRDVQRSFGSKAALEGVSFSVSAGRITGFLGPNGAGKTTAIRILLGLDDPDNGTALVFGAPFRRLDRPMLRVGALLDGAGFHPGRTARNHLLVLADVTGISSERVDAVLDEVGLADAAARKVGGFSLGMRRRLALACALLGQPRLLILDEPANGLDPGGIRWLRTTLREFADGGGTVLVSSHVLAEVAQTADDVVVINRGRIVTQTSVAELTAETSVEVSTPQRERLGAVLEENGATTRPTGTDGLHVTGMAQEEVGLAAAAAAIPLFELTRREHTLEETFFSLTEKGAESAQS